jgi:nicotinate phosphoribosyltransferase
MHSSLATDLYQLTMMAGYQHAGITGRSTFELFVRHLPPGRGFLVAAGVEQALELLEGLRFTPDEIRYLRTVPALAAAPEAFFAGLLPSFRFTGEVWAVAEGEVVFPHEPMLRVTAPAAEAQLVETALLATVTFQTSIASKAARVVHAAGGARTSRRTSQPADDTGMAGSRAAGVIEFGSRRAHGLDAALHAARAAYVAGCVGTSNVEAGYRFGIPVSGTMAHSWVMSFAREIDAFREYLALFGDRTTLLIDTYDTIAAAQAIVAAGLRPGGVRLDSGDLVALSREVRRVLDEGGLAMTEIIVSGDLDEYRIAQLLAEGAPIDAFGVGTALSTSNDAPALGGVYKLAEIERAGEMAPVLKLSAGKRTLPGSKQVWRISREGCATGDVLALAGEPSAGGRPLLTHVMRNGRRVRPSANVEESRRHAAEALRELPAGVRRLQAWDAYPVRVSDALAALAARVADERVWS